VGTASAPEQQSCCQTCYGPAVKALSASLCSQAVKEGCTPYSLLHMRRPCSTLYASTQPPKHSAPQVTVTVLDAPTPPSTNPAIVLKAPTAKTGATVCTAKRSAAHHSPPHSHTQLQLQHRTAQLAATEAAAAAVSKTRDTRYTPAPLAAS
jgi:hypothetical protein